VLLATVQSESYLFVLTRDSFHGQNIHLRVSELSEKVAAFRRGLDVDMVED